jgi:hypothetical protein
MDKRWSRFSTTSLVSYIALGACGDEMDYQISSDRTVTAATEKKTATTGGVA